MISPTAASPTMKPRSTDSAWYEPPKRDGRRFDGRRCESRYIEMPDGVRIAVDVWLPGDLGADDRLPAILHQTRYMRSVQLRPMLRLALGGKPFDHTNLYRTRRNRFLRHGYAWLDVDVRGSGASFGEWVCPWSPWEVSDGNALVDWIVAQSWSSGVVGSTGISYDGSAAELLLVNNHPAVKAAAPRFSSFEPFTDIAFPGGVFQQRFIREWHNAGDALDRNAPHEIAGQAVRVAITGVGQVDGRDGKRLRGEAVAEHTNNCDVYGLVSGMPCRDSEYPQLPVFQDDDWKQHLVGRPRRTLRGYDLISSSNYVDDLDDSGAAVYAYSGWFDIGYAHAAIKRFMTLKNTRLLLGPWNHCGGYDCNPTVGPTRTSFDHDSELLRFFDLHLKGEDHGFGDDAPVHYFTMVEQRWKSAQSWPPPADAQRHYFDAESVLSTHAPSDEQAHDSFVPDYGCGTGEYSRWRGGVEANKKVDYGDRRAQDARMLCFTSPPLDADTEVTGHPLVTLFVQSSADDGHFFVYLEDVHPDGRSTYVTEGMLRAQHRTLSDAEPPYPHAVPFRSLSKDDLAPLVAGEVAELTFDLMPTSYLYERGHRIRVAIAGADSSSFALNPPEPPQLRLERNARHASHVVLPVIAR